MNLRRGSVPNIPYAELLLLAENGHNYAAIQEILFSRYHHRWHIQNIRAALTDGREKIGPPMFFAHYYIHVMGLTAKHAARRMYDMFGYHWNDLLVRQAAHRYIRWQQRAGVVSCSR